MTSLSTSMLVELICWQAGHAVVELEETLARRAQKVCPMDDAAVMMLQGCGHHQSRRVFVTTRPLNASSRDFVTTRP